MHLTQFLLTRLRPSNDARSILTRIKLKNFSNLRPKHQQQPQQPNQVPEFKIQLNKLIKPFLFTITIGGTSFVAANIIEYETNRRKKFRNLKQFLNENFDYQRRSDWFQQIKNQYWDSKRDGFKVFCSIFAINCLIFACWHVPKFHPFMVKYFVSKIESNSIKIAPMVLSNFSHYSLAHFGMNMFVLYSFCNLGVHLFGRENFCALYLSSGVMSSFVSLLHKTLTKSPVSSLGASGAILGILGAICLERPDIQLMIVFLPFFKFSSYTALQSIVIFDTLGVLLRWGFFDHAAHLGGTLFGIYYTNSLKEYLMKHKISIIKQWKSFKKQIQN